ncbi:hypothetical protein PHYBLDRAFT_68452 [Phycomyces blakesleeanus NRRL 1555(-)]|uniref:Uncharacterized protein n=1 Tax=Phycomyces blakesleeanus (strain ATCC 8743b / DSM 1359 / FGSC 10004 / NBRC 33097 / NRRL 1555) TaxID=763407 RepID=A0A162UU87_PHYB8|nr:hypothetical protein PHYBLDRAFT_68452 [Phycomyces blakesleeanus NRRL 1555(-)]OAD78043.1 hypothetical protein PHYBLDRAFT_68452 [Phycomyces blakesleeanus NRRL 1555(-)]|eukprot:XP_018296083.1 hypothetical protein PHYBLDRAFT_68452 [Phycomyces blakesleeanus NRRL 1555(-)]
MSDFYKKQAITPNMHLHLHLSKCINDFGPVYAFWLLSFEHYNGLLKNFETDQKEWYTSYTSESYQPLMTENIELWNEPLTTLKYDCILPVHCLYLPIAAVRYRLNITSDFKRLVMSFLQKIEA